MDIYELTRRAFSRDLTDASALIDAFNAVRILGDTDPREAHRLCRTVRSVSAREAVTQKSTQMLEINRAALLFDAPADFDAYLQVLEWNRRPQDKFYMPRRRIMKRVADALQRLEDRELDELFLSMPPRVGKLLADDTPILTPQGWKTHGALRAGDYVYAPNGKPVKVIAVHEKHHTTHRVTLTDGSEFDCHFRHEWKVYDRRFGRVRTLEVQEMLGHLESNAENGNVRGHRYNFMLVPKEPVEGTHKNLPVPPYTLGAWLGDGTNTDARITDPDSDRAIVDAIAQDGYAVQHVYVHKITGVPTTDFGGPLRRDLQKLGLCHSNRTVRKYIPEEYLTASIEQRLDLLAGLLDTDGCLRRKEHRYDFSTTEENLKDGVEALVSTFGWRCCTSKKEPHTSSFGIVGKKPYWVISFNPTMYIPCRLERKQLHEFSKPRRIAIKSIVEAPPKQGNCITVEGDGMYLAGKHLTPTHNSSMLMFYVTWLLGRDSERSNLYSAYSGIITTAFYNGVLEVLNDPVTYAWKEIFPGSKIAATNAKDETVDIGRKKRYPSITCRSLYGTLNGACDCNGTLMSDDLIGGIEEAMNKDRLVSAWSRVDNNLLPRAKEQARILWCGTRWSMIDPAGIRMDLLLNDERFRSRRFEIINLPALDEHEESNFFYLHGVGFSTEYYKQRRASFERNNDMASWLAQYQGEPIERSGALFEPEDMRFYNGVLPDAEPVRKFMAIDPAFGGGDFTASPVCYQYEDDSVYVVDVVYTDGEKRVSQPQIVQKVKAHGIQAIQIEANKSTLSYKEEVDRLLQSEGLRVNITTKNAPNTKSKENRIFDKAAEIREFYFLEDGKRSKDYSLFMQNVFSFKVTGKNKHDDAVDSLAQAVDMVLNRKPKVSVFRRPF